MVDGMAGEIGIDLFAFKSYTHTAQQNQRYRANQDQTKGFPLKIVNHLSRLRQEVCDANRSLPLLGLVVMHSGNASGYDPISGKLVIKPSGIDYAQLTPDMLVEVDVETGHYDSTLRPSVDLPHHLFLYRNLPGIFGVVHTHSNHATAFAACGESIPVCLTAIADEFGDTIPCAPYVSNEGDAIGRSILEYKTDATAVLLGKHGVFTWGKSPTAALKSAAMVEDIAKTVILAKQIGRIEALPQDQIHLWNDRYKHRYGQKKAA
jgi:L-ribulose-5-phosphate 4-epimerase